MLVVRSERPRRGEKKVVALEAGSVATRLNDLDTIRGGLRVAVSAGSDFWGVTKKLARSTMWSGI